MKKINIEYFNLIKSVSSIILFTFIGKLLSLVSRLMMANIIGVGAMSVFSLINPIMILLINLSQMGLPLGVSNLISKRPKDSKKIFISGFVLSMMFSIVFMSVTYFLAPIISGDILENNLTLPAIYGLGLLIPLVSTSALVKGLYIGQGKIKYTTFSTMAEEISRLLFIIFFIENFSNISPSFGALGAVIGVCVGELFQTLYLFFIAPHYQKITAIKLLNIKEVENTFCFKELLSISLPVVGARIIASIGFFFEPIIFTKIMKANLVSSETILRTYGIINGYIFPLLSMPAFFSLALGNIILKEVSSFVYKKQYKKAYEYFNVLTILSLVLGGLISLCFFFFPEHILLLFYRSKEGADYLKQISIPFILFYIESPIISCMHGISKTKSAARVTIISSFIRIISLLIFTKHYKGLAIAISELISILFTVSVDYFIIKKFFKSVNN